MIDDLTRCPFLQMVSSTVYTYIHTYQPHPQNTRVKIYPVVTAEAPAPPTQLLVAPVFSERFLFFFLTRDDLVLFSLAREIPLRLRTDRRKIRSRACHKDH